MEEHSNPHKVFVSVYAEFDPDGGLIPLSFVWEDGKRYTIDRVIDVRRAASLKAGGTGTRYTCVVLGRQTHLYRDEDTWFMERRNA